MKKKERQVGRGIRYSLKSATSFGRCRDNTLREETPVQSKTFRERPEENIIPSSEIIVHLPIVMISLPWRQLGSWATCKKIVLDMKEDTRALLYTLGSSIFKIPWSSMCREFSFFLLFSLSLSVCLSVSRTMSRSF
jgi:hypothetical protein